MRRLAASVLICSSLGAPPAVAAAGPEFGSYYALVIGINDYRHLKPLETAVAGAKAVHETLRQQYGFKSTLLLNPDRDALVRALDGLRETLSERDNLLIYYAGHGYLDRQSDEGFWLPANAEESSQVEWVPISTITRLLKATAAKHALVIADSCYSGTLTRDAGVALPSAPTDRQVELARLSAKRARKALTSGGMEPVSDGGGDGQSVFTRALLQALKENDQVLDGDALFRAVRRQVVVNARQTPEYSDVRFAGDEGGDFLFVPTGAPERLALAVPSRSGVAPRPGADGFLSKQEIKALIVGKTVRFTSSSNGQVVRLYFTRDGKIEAVNEGKPGNVATKYWWLGGRQGLCRTHGKQNERACNKLRYDAAAHVLSFFKPDDTKVFDAELLEGRQLGD